MISGIKPCLCENLWWYDCRVWSTKMMLFFIFSGSQANSPTNPALYRVLDLEFQAMHIWDTNEWNDLCILLLTSSKKLRDRSLLVMHTAVAQVCAHTSWCHPGLSRLKKCIVYIFRYGEFSSIAPIAWFSENSTFLQCLVCVWTYPPTASPAGSVGCRRALGRV